MSVKKRNIMHLEVTPQLKEKLAVIAKELRADPRLEGVKITRQTALRHAVTSYQPKEARG